MRTMRWFFALTLIAPQLHAEPEKCQFFFSSLFASLFKAEDDSIARFPKAVSLKEQKRLMELAQKQLKKRKGLRFRIDDEDRYPSYLYRWDNIDQAEDAEKVAIRTLILDEISTPGKKAKVDSPFLDHREAGKLLKEIQTHGYALVLDPSFSAAGARTGGYHQPSETHPFIMIGPSTKFHVVIHEFEHLKFDKEVVEAFKKSEIYKQYKEADQKLPSYFWDGDDSKRLYQKFFELYLQWLKSTPEGLSPYQQKAVELYEKGIQLRSSIDETFATNAQLELFDKERVGRWSQPRLQARHYQIYHQLLDLESRTSNWNEADTLRWARLKLEKKQIESLRFLKELSKSVGLGLTIGFAGKLGYLVLSVRAPTGQNVTIEVEEPQPEKR